MRKNILKIKKIFFSLVFTLTILLMTACGNDSKKDTANLDTKEYFLQIFFTTDYHQRYTRLQNNTATIPSVSSAEDAGKIQQLIDEYYSKYYSEFSNITTEDELKTLISNREPLKYDKSAMENNQLFVVDNIKIDVYDKETGVYSFEVELVEKDGADSYIYTGQLSVIEEDGREKISNMRVSSGTQQ